MTAPCPSCGSRPFAVFVHGGVRLECLRCGCFGPVASDILEAGVAWDSMTVRLSEVSP